MKQTTNYNLIKPELTDSPPDITAMNPNWDAIDTELKSHDDKLKNLSAYAVASGTNTYTATIAGITALTEGMTVKIKFANANTGASTLNINSLGAKAIVKSNGSALSSGNIKAGQICNLAYTSSNFQLLGEGGEYGTATALDVLSGKTIGTEEGLVVGTMPNRGAVNQNLTTEGQEYTIPAGYHNGLGKIKAVITGLAASVIKAGASVGGIAGTFTNDATATAAQMLSGATAYVKGAKLTGTIPSKGAQTFTPGTTNQTIAVGQYLSGVQTIVGSANLVPANIKDGVNIFGKMGTYTGVGIKRIIRGTVTLNGTFRKEEITLSPAVVNSNTFVLVNSCPGRGDVIAAGLISAYISTDGGKLILYGNGYSISSIVGVAAYQLIEFSSGVNVQHIYDKSFSSANITINIPVPVNYARSFFVFSYTGNTLVDDYKKAMVYGYINANNNSIYLGRESSGGTITADCFVVTFL